MAKTGLARDMLKSFVERLARPHQSLEDRKAIYREAKMAGFDREALRQTVAFAKMDKADAREAWATLDLYMTNTVLE